MKLTPVYLAIFLAIVCMSTSSILIRFCTAPAIVMAFYRLVFTSGLGMFWSKEILTGNIPFLSRRDKGFIIIAGIFLALHLGFWITSLSYTSISSSVLFTNQQVIFVLIFSIIFLKEKVTLPISGGIIIALGGCFLIASGDLQQGKLFGDMLALTSGLFVAIYYIIGRNIRPRIEAMPYTVLVSAVAALVLLPFIIFSGINLTGYTRLDWLLFVLMALLPGLGGHGVLNWALKYVKAPIVSVSILGESVGASILGLIIFQEILLPYQIIGGILILAGIYTATVSEQPTLSER
ncbi:MAG: DMT family transporter [Syntrophomonadaceae bacterium]|jgi:drug/metabolite transporter (DMT)-like permease